MKNFFNRIMMAMQRFMNGRYGIDQLAVAILLLYVLLTTIASFINANATIIHYVLLLLLVILYFRIFSKNIYRRSQENAAFLRYYNPIQKIFRKSFSRIKKSKDYKYFKCPNCHMELRVPRKKGKIIITCPSCHHTFERKS